MTTPPKVGIQDGSDNESSGPLLTVEDEQAHDGVQFEALQNLMDPHICPNDLSVLDLSSKGLVTIPEQVFRFHELRELYLQGNKIRFIPTDIFARLQHLTHLDLRNNEVERIPPEIGSHKVIKTLLLQNNRITALPVEMG